MLLDWPHDNNGCCFIMSQLARWRPPRRYSEILNSNLLSGKSMVNPVLPNFTQSTGKGSLHMKSTHSCTCIYQELQIRPIHCNRARVRFPLLSRGISRAFINSTTNINMPGVPINPLPISTIYTNIQILPYSCVLPTNHNKSYDEGFLSITRRRVLSDGGNQSIYCHVATNNHGC